MLYRLICRVCSLWTGSLFGERVKNRWCVAAKALVLSLRSVWCHSNTSHETFRFAFPPGKMKVRRAWYQLNSAGRVISKIRLLVKSRNLCKLSLFRFHSRAWFLYFYTFLSMLRRLSSKASMGFKLQWQTKLFWFFSFTYQRPLVIKHGLNTWLNNKTSCSRDFFILGRALCHALLFSLYLAFFPRSWSFVG